MDHTSRPARLPGAARLAASLAAALAAPCLWGAGADDGPGLPNLDYEAKELFTTIGQINAASGAPNGHSLVGMHKGWLAVIGSLDGGKGDGHLSFYDISDPRAPKLAHHVYDQYTKRLREAHTIAQCTRDGRDLVALQGQKAIQFWDWTDIRAPSVVCELELPPMKGGDYGNTPWWTAWQGRWLYVGGLDTGLHIVDTSDVRAPKVAARIPCSELGGFSPGALHAVGNLLVMVAVEGNRGIATMDIGDPLRPVLLDRKADATISYSGTLYGDKLVMVGKARPKKETPKTKPGQPKPPPPPPEPIDPTGQLIDFNAIHIYDLADPTSIAYLGHSPNAGGGGGYASVQDGMIFAGMSGNFVLVPLAEGAPKEVKHRTVPGKSAPVEPKGADYDFCTAMGNLIFSSSDHGDGSYILPHQAAPDRNPPVVTMINPRPGAAGQALTSRVGMILSDQIDQRTLGAASFIVRPKGGEPLPGLYTYQTSMVNFCPDQPLRPDTVYEVVLPKGGLVDLCGNALAEEYTSTFTTGPAAPATGAGGDAR